MNRGATERQLVSQMIHARTGKALWQWGEEARRKLDFYCSTATGKTSDRETAVRSIVAMLEGEGSHDS